MVQFKEGDSIKAYEILAKHFDIDQLRKVFEPQKKGPSPGTKLYLILHPKKVNKFGNEPDAPARLQINVKDDEPKDKKAKADAKDTASKNFMLDVYTLAEIIEEHQKDIENQIKRIEGASKRGQSRIDRISSAHPSKTVMCPLGEHCPDFQKNKWPVSNQKGIKPIGENCPFAHHPFHIASKAFLKNNAHLKKDLIKKLKQELQTPNAVGSKDKSWNPAGNPLSVSARYFNIKDARSNYNSANLAVSQTFNARAKNHNDKLKSSKKVQDKMKDMKQEDDNYRKKMGFLNRSKVLYNKRRYKEAFESIIKAIAIVKKEDSQNAVKHEAEKKRLKKKLDLSFGSLNR